MSVLYNLSEICPYVTDGNHTYGDEYCIMYRINSLCRTPETNTTWYIHYTSIKKIIPMFSQPINCS